MFQMEHYPLMSVPSNLRFADQADNRPFRPKYVMTVSALRKWNMRELVGLVCLERKAISPHIDYYHQVIYHITR